MAREDVPIFKFPQQQKVAIGFIKSLNGLYTFDVRRCSDQRSLSQNSYWHGVMFVYVAKGLSDAWGRKVSVQEAKAVCKDRFLRREVLNPDTGEVIPGYYYTAGTSDLDTREGWEFTENVREWSLDQLGTYIPEPNEFEDQSEQQRRTA